MLTNTKESGFEALIVKWLVEHNGYEEGLRQYRTEKSARYRQV